MKVLNDVEIGVNYLKPKKVVLPDGETLVIPNTYTKKVKNVQSEIEMKKDLADDNKVMQIKSTETEIRDTLKDRIERSEINRGKESLEFKKANKNAYENKEILNTNMLNAVKNKKEVVYENMDKKENKIGEKTINFDGDMLFISTQKF